MANVGSARFVRPLEDLDAVARAYAERTQAVPPAQRDRLRERLAECCLPFANRIARRYRGRGEPLEDLEQVARLGLMKAINRYEPERGSFTAYALMTMTGELKRHFRDATWGMHVPRQLQELALEVRPVAADLASELRRAPTLSEIADRVGSTAGAVEEALGSSANHSPASLNAPPPGGNGTGELGDQLGASDGRFESVENKVTLAGLFGRLPAREREMLALRFFGNHTQSEIADRLGISQMHVSRQLSRALGWLREAMLSDDPPPDGAFNAGHHRFEVRLRRAGHAHTLEIRGEIDRDTAGRLRLSLSHAISTTPAGLITVDLSRVPLVDAAGVGALMEAAAAADAAGVALRLVGANPFVRHVLAVTGMAHLLAQPRKPRGTAAPRYESRSRRADDDRVRPAGQQVIARN